MKKTVLIMATALAIVACGPKQAAVPALDLANLDTSVEPGQDFYKYATHGWQEKNPLKPEYSRYGTFEVLREQNEERINALFSEMTKMTTTPGTPEQKIVDLYKQGLDSVKLNSEGLAPLKKYLDMLYAVSSKDDLVTAVAYMHNNGADAFFGTYAGADLKNSDMTILYVGQSGLGMGQRDYYVDPKNAALKEGYRNYLKRVFTLTGNPDPQKAADNVLSVEDVLALNSWTREQERDVLAGYNPMSTAEFETKFSGFDYSKYFQQRGIASQEKMVVGEPSYFAAFGKFFASTDLEALKDYCAAHIIREGAESLNDELYTAAFDFFSKQMSGIQEQKPRWKRAMSVPNGVLGQAVGKMYVEKYFPESSKEKMLTLVENLREALGQHIDELDWMGGATKAKAQEKLAAFTVKIGYPDKWKDYSSLQIDPHASYFENNLAVGRWYIQDNLKKLGKAPDKTEWGMSPQTVNAYYSPSRNEICFPAAILQPPFFNPDADDAVNYGGIGVVIGHEMSHGFDDQGRMFDKDGNMVSWWTEEDDAKFKAKSAVLIDQYNKIEILPGLMANGTVTLGENIGDHGGVSIAFTAMQNAIAGNRPEPIDGFTPEQRFYLSFATIWASNFTDEEKARRTATDVHSLAPNRVNATVRNFESFFEAFSIKEGDPMWLPEAERVHIW